MISEETWHKAIRLAERHAYNTIILKELKNTETSEEFLGYQRRRTAKSEEDVNKSPLASHIFQQAVTFMSLVRERQKALTSSSLGDLVQTLELLEIPDNREPEVFKGLFEGNDVLREEWEKIRQAVERGDVETLIALFSDIVSGVETDLGYLPLPEVRARRYTFEGEEFVVK